MVKTITYDDAIGRIRKDGHLFDVGQISESVITQLYHSPSTVKVDYDSWPIRGCGKGSGEWKRIFKLIK